MDNVVDTYMDQVHNQQSTQTYAHNKICGDMVRNKLRVTLSDKAKSVLQEAIDAASNNRSM